MRQDSREQRMDGHYVKKPKYPWQSEDEWPSGFENMKPRKLKWLFL